MNFETSLKKLEELSELIRNENTTLDDAIKYYEDGIECYNQCSQILNAAKQKIEVFSK